MAFQGNLTYSNLKAQPGGYQVQYLATAVGMYQLRGRLMQVGGLYAEYYENNDLTDNGIPDTSAFNRIDPDHEVDGDVSDEEEEGLEIPT